MQSHELVWTPERIQAFWDYYSTNQAHADTYYSRLHGRSLISYVRRHIHIGTPLDYGCGGGDLLVCLAEAGCNEVYGVEQSPESRMLAARKVGGRAILHLGDDVSPDSVDTAFLIEVVEHMNDDALASAFAQIRRALRPGGHLVITTPNDEDLSANSVLCPECRAVFHVMQHVRSWNAGSLSAYAEAQGFRTISAEATILSRFGGLADKLFRAIKLSQKKRPHLIYIGQVT